MKIILMLAALLALNSCHPDFYQNQLRDYTNQILSTSKAIAMAPFAVFCSMGYYVDFVIGASNGYLYFGNLNDQNLKYSSHVTQNAIKNLHWTDKGLHIVTQYEIKVIDPSLDNQNLFSMSFSSEIKNAVFGVDGSTILTAINFSDRIEIFENSSSINNISLNDCPCFTMSFNLSGECFCSMNNQILKFDAFNRTIGYVKLQQKESYQKSVRNYGQSKRSVSSRVTQTIKTDNKSFLWRIGAYQNMKNTEDGINLIGKIDNKILRIFDNPECKYLLNEYDYQTLYFDNGIIDYDTKRQNIIVLLLNQKIVIFTNGFYIHGVSGNIWIVVFGGFFVFLLAVGLVEKFIKQQRIRKQQKNKAYVQQADIANNVQLLEAIFEIKSLSQNLIANPIAPPNYHHRFAVLGQNQQNQGFVSNQFSNNQEELKENYQSQNNPYKLQQ